jgi:glycosyltransferase involved in cell wall biosynthesis
MLRVLITGHVGKPVGGVATFYEALLASRLSHEVQLVFLETSGGETDFRKRGRLSASLVVNGLAVIWRFVKNISSQKPDVVHIWTTHGYSFVKNSVLVGIASVWGFRVVLHVHCGVEALIPSQRPLWRRFVFFVMRRCRGIIVLSTDWLRIEGVLPRVKVAFIPNAINPAEYISILREESPHVHHDVTILFLGHIGEQKGVGDLLLAASKMKGKMKEAFRFDLVGESLMGGERERFQEQSQHLGLDGLVRFYEPEYGSAKVARLTTADIFVLPSHSEGMPMVILEAMASGLPIVATRVGGIPDMIMDGETGVMVNPGCPDDLAEAIGRLVDDPHLRFALGTRAREWVQMRFDLDTLVDSLVQLYKEVCCLT